MLTIKKEFSMYDFIEEFKELSNVCFTDNHVALGIIYDSLCEAYDDLEHDFISDYVRFQVMEMEQDDFINSYDNLLNIDDDSDEDEKHEEIERVLNYYTYYLGSYEYNGKIYYLFDEF